MKTVRLLLSCLVAVAGGVPFAAADEVPALTLAVPFADRAVLQREKPIRIWGTGVPGAKVSVRLLPSSLRYLHGDNWYGSLKNEMSLPLGPFQIDIAAH